ncbi:MAG: chemotaxis protein CheW [Devosia sp.]|jgi:purine-binding chemotaxis protein CheW|uniref:chemotaxis protein CheW n=1 Tax=Devosia sp. TaxID=1871048 RepID=UPI0037BF8266
MAERIQYVTLGVAKEIFAAPVTKVQEILDMRPIARLPQAPENLLGMIDVRGQGIPVLDLRRTLGLEEAADSENTRIVVLRMGSGEKELTVGLRADRVFEVTVLDQEELDPPPAISDTWDTHSIAGIGRRNGAFVTVLDLDRLLAGIRIPGLKPALATEKAA